MRKVTRSRVEIIQHATPHAYVEMRGDTEVLVIPTYDIDTDRTDEIVMAVIDDPKTGPQPYKPGDVHFTRDGKPFKIVGVSGAKPKVRKGPTFKPDK